MSTSNPSRPHASTIGSEDGESFDSIPWESLHTLNRPVDRRRWYLIAGVVLLVAVGVSAIGRLAPDVPASPVSTPIVATTAVSVPPTTVPPAVTEADLMAIDVDVLERAAAALAEVAVREYFSGETDGIWAGVLFDGTRSTYVEHVSAVTVTPITQTSYEILVVASVLDAAEGEPFIRRPLRAVTVVVDATDGNFRPVDLPSPTALPFGTFDAPAVSEKEPDPAVIDAIASEIGLFGDVGDAPLSYGTTDEGELRVVITMVDEAGVAWPMAFTIDDAGAVRPSP